jgi:hypothetical protein
MTASLGKILLASAVMAACVYGVTTASHAWVESVRLARIVDVAVGVPAGALVFYATASALGIAELADASGAVRRKFGRAV